MFVNAALMITASADGDFEDRPGRSQASTSRFSRGDSSCSQALRLPRSARRAGLLDTVVSVSSAQFGSCVSIPMRHLTVTERARWLLAATRSPNHNGSHQEGAEAAVLDAV